MQDSRVARRLDGIRVDKTFTDKASGKDTKRPQFQAALEYLREGDVLVVHSMDRLARNLDDLRRIVADLTGRGIVIEFVKEKLTFNGDDSALSLLSVGRPNFERPRQAQAGIRRQPLRVPSASAGRRCTPTFESTG